MYFSVSECLKLICSSVNAYEAVVSKLELPPAETEEVSFCFKCDRPFLMTGKVEAVLNGLYDTMEEG